MQPFCSTLVFSPPLFSQPHLTTNQSYVFYHNPINSSNIHANHLTTDQLIPQPTNEPTNQPTIVFFDDGAHSSYDVGGAYERPDAKKSTNRPTTLTNQSTKKSTNQPNPIQPSDHFLPLRYDRHCRGAWLFAGTTRAKSTDGRTRKRE